MIVKSSFIQIITLWLLSLIEQISPAGIRCNVPLLNKYFLAGLEYSIYHQMKVCPMVRERCCSLNDETIIQNAWNTRSKVLLNRHAEKCIENIEKTVKDFFRMMRLDPLLIMVKHGVPRQLPIRIPICSTVLRRIRRRDVGRMEGYFRFSNQTQHNWTMITPPDRFNNTWQSRNPLHYNWNVANQGLNYRMPMPRPNFGAHIGPFISPENVHGVHDEHLYFNPPPFNINNQGPRLQKNPLPQIPEDAFRKSKRGRKLQLAPSRSRDIMRTPFAASRTRLRGRNRQSYRPTVMNRVVCRNQNRSFLKEFVIVNTAKVDFCLSIYRGFLNFDMEMFQEFIPAVKGAMIAIHDIKKGFYCTLCDANKISIFDYSKKSINYNFNFCLEVLQTHTDYFRFMHIIYIRYANQLLQYIQCFESDARVFTFPYQNFLVKYMRRIRFWEACLSNLGEEYERFCWSICNKWNITSVAPLFDGDLPLLERITSTISSFLRKWRTEWELFLPIRKKYNRFSYINQNLFNLHVTDNVNGLLMEPINPAMFISNGRYMPNAEQQLGFFNVSGGKLLNNLHERQIIVNELLRLVARRNWTAVKQFVERPFVIHQAPQHINNFWMENEDRTRSTINGIVNQLFALRTQVQNRPAIRPRPYLKNRILKILHSVGIDPKHLQDRSLHTYRWNGTNITYNGTWRARRRIIPSNFSDFDSTGLPILFQNSTKQELEDDLEAGYTEDNFLIENIAPMYVNIEPDSGVEEFAYSTSKRGLDPNDETRGTSFRYNVSRLIGLQYVVHEKIDPEVIGIFIKSDSISINLFNEVCEEETLDPSEMQLKNDGYKKFGKFVWTKSLIDQFTSYGLFKRLEKLETSKMNSMIHSYKKRVNKEKFDLAMREILKTVAIGKMEDMNNFPVIHHTQDRSFFDTMFETISDLFLGLFGN